MNYEKEGNNPINQAKPWIREATIAAIGIQIQRHRHHAPDSTRSASDVIQQAMYKSCVTTSMDTILHLYFTHPSLTDSLFLLGTHDHPAWDRHIVVCGHIPDVGWFSSSPTNIQEIHCQDNKNDAKLALKQYNPLINIYQDLTALLSQISAQERGYWPSSLSVERLLRLNSDLRVPKQVHTGSGFMTMLEIMQTKTKPDSVIHQCMIPSELWPLLPSHIELYPQASFRNSQWDE